MRLLKIFILVLVPVMVQAKGASGTYYIKGIAYGANKSVIRDAILQVKIGDNTLAVNIDANGRFTIPVRWTVPCISGPAWNRKKRAKIRSKYNPDFIYISLGSQTTRISNKWKKYGSLFPTKEESTWKHDLRF